MQLMFFGSNFCTVVEGNLMWGVQRKLLIKKCKNKHNLKKRSEKSPYLCVCRIKWNPKLFLLCWLTSNQIWFIFFVDVKFTYLTKLKNSRCNTHTHNNSLIPCPKLTIFAFQSNYFNRHTSLAIINSYEKYVVIFG